MSIYTCPSALYSFSYLFFFPNLSFWLISPPSGYVFILSLPTNIIHNVKFPFLSFSYYSPPFFDLSVQCQPLAYFSLSRVFPPPSSFKFPFPYHLSFFILTCLFLLFSLFLLFILAIPFSFPFCSILLIFLFFLHFPTHSFSFPNF